MKNIKHAKTLKYSPIFQEQRRHVLDRQLLN